MLIDKVAQKIGFFAHVPGCAGLSVVNCYLSDRFGGIAFDDRAQTARAVDGRWSRSSPQHVDRAGLNRLFPASFCGATFAVVRHPVDRLISVQHFQRHDLDPTGRPYAADIDRFGCELDDFGAGRGTAMHSAAAAPMPLLRRRRQRR